MFTLSENVKRMDAEPASNNNAHNTTVRLAAPAIDQHVPSDEANDEAGDGRESSPSLPSSAGNQCASCLDDLDPTKEGEEFLIPFPIPHCSHAYCFSCLRAMFIGASKDPSRMPPRCCHWRIQFHFVRRLLSASEADDFRAKYDEWNTPRPLYCPVAACSAFIPQKLLETAKKPAESLVGNPTPALVDCPRCSMSICIHCRAAAHSDAPCQLQHGLDPEIERSLKAEGYKRCPRCGNAVKRTDGCYIMLCQCGSQWCWICRVMAANCRGHSNKSLRALFIQDAEQEEHRSGRTAHQQIGPGAPEQNDERPLDEPKNTGSEYWEGLAINNFGRPPRPCSHSFSPMRAEDMKRKLPEGYTECNICWAEIYPRVRTDFTRAPTGGPTLSHSGGSGMFRPRTTQGRWWRPTSLHFPRQTQRSLTVREYSGHTSSPLSNPRIIEQTLKPPPFPIRMLRRGKIVLSTSNKADRQSANGRDEKPTATATPSNEQNASPPGVIDPATQAIHSPYTKGAFDHSKVAWQCRHCGTILCPVCTREIQRVLAEKKAM